MPELAFAIRQDVFRILGGLKKGPMEVWWLLVKLLEVGPDYVHIPSKLSADARVLVEVGIVQENESGQFRVSPDVAYVSNEPTVGEVLHETA